MNGLLNNDPLVEAAFKAAKFFAGGAEPVATAREVLRIYEGDIVSAAMLAYELPMTEAMTDSINALLPLFLDPDNSLEKSEIQGVCKAVLPHNSEDVNFLNDAIGMGDVYKVKTNGRSLDGYIVKTKNGQWFLKPNPPHATAHMFDNDSTPSGREEAFFEICLRWDSHHFIPAAMWITFNDEEMSAIRLLPNTFFTLDELRRKGESVRVFNAINKYNNNGLLLRWAVLDYLLGNIDRHGNNIMVGDLDTLTLIDHGLCFAVKDFNPHNKNVFTPYYLRYAALDGFPSMPPADRYAKFPRPHISVIRGVDDWVKGLDLDELKVLQQYGIDAHYFELRLTDLQAQNSPTDFVLKWWAGLDVAESFIHQ